jgi:hypothetical protein
LARGQLAVFLNLGGLLPQLQLLPPRGLFPSLAGLLLVLGRLGFARIHEVMREIDDWGMSG